MAGAGVRGGMTMGVNRKFCYTEAQCKFAEEVIRTLSKEIDGSENQWERGYNAGLSFAIKTLQRFKNNYAYARVEG